MRIDSAAWPRSGHLSLFAQRGRLGAVDGLL